MFSILTVKSEPGQVRLVLNQKTSDPSAAWRFSREEAWKRYGEDNYANYFGRVYLLCNRRTHEALLVKDVKVERRSKLSFDPGAALGALTYTIKYVDFSTADEQGRPIVKVDDAWLADAELVRLDAVKVGSVKKKIEIPGFTLPEEKK
jgi:hypothetical protein